MMISKLSAESKHILHLYIENKNIRKMADYRQHGATTTFDHCLHVTIISCNLAKVFKLKQININNIIVGAMLHDFYLYDWHTGRRRKEGIHGFCHPKTALKNAEKLFNLNAKQKNIIRSHMFPITLLHPPKCKEAWIVTLADKYCAIQEYIAGRNIKSTRKQEYNCA